ncbi:MAG: TRAP transporter substrate-binding protein [Candidatus Sedimenticola sp. 20ELBAFRAG]
MPLRMIITAALVLSVAILSAPVLAAPVVIKFSHVVAEDTPKGQMASRFKTLVEQRLGDSVKVEVYPNSRLFGDNKVLEAMLLGDVQLAAPSLSKFKSFTGKLQLFDLPFLFNDMQAVERFQSGPSGQQLLMSMEREGLLGLGYLHNGMKQLSASRPLRRPEDAASLKFRIMTSDVLAAQFEAVGAIPRKKPFSEVFTLLQTGAIDGQENTWSNIYSKKFFQLQPYITESNHGVVDYMVVTSTAFWRGLPGELRDELKQALDEAIAFGNRVAEEKAIADRQAIITSGRSEVLSLTPTQRDQWIEAMRPVWKRFEVQIGKSLIDAAYSAND